MRTRVETQQNRIAERGRALDMDWQAVEMGVIGLKEMWAEPCSGVRKRNQCSNEEGVGNAPVRIRDRAGDDT